MNSIDNDRGARLGPGRQARSGRLGRWRTAALAGVLGMVLAGLAGCGKEGGQATPAPPSSPPPGASAPSAPAAPAELQKLLGRWVRPDGGYVLEVSQIGSDGRAEVGYFNPNPIHVSKAEARREASASKLFVELRDSGYPGCTYNLTHEPQSDSLVGKYFQAAMQQEFDVVFVRMKQ